MKVWELRNGGINDVAMLVYGSEDELYSGMFDADGQPLEWTFRPHANVFIEPRKKRAKPRVDVSLLGPGVLVLNTKAMAAIGEFLSNFGQLLELDVDGEVEWFYNVTHVIDCIDLDRSTLRPEGSIAKEAFLPEKIPVDPTVFKDPHTARTRIYVNDSARQLLKKLIASAGITGVEFAEPGPRLPKPRPAA